MSSAEFSPLALWEKRVSAATGDSRPLRFTAAALAANLLANPHMRAVQAIKIYHA